MSVTQEHCQSQGGGSSSIHLSISKLISPHCATPLWLGQVDTLPCQPKIRSLEPRRRKSDPPLSGSSLITPISAGTPRRHRGGSRTLHQRRRSRDLGVFTPPFPTIPKVQPQLCGRTLDPNFIRINHPLDIRPTDLRISNIIVSRKIHGRQPQQKIEVYLSRQGIPYEHACSFTEVTLN